MNNTPIAATAITEQARKTLYPAPFASVVAGRTKRWVGDHFGLTHYGVNLTQLAPGAASALLHSHSEEDELVYIVAGTAVLILDTAEFTMQAGDCCGFKAGTGKAHQHVDLKIGMAPDGRRFAAHKDGTPY